MNRVFVFSERTMFSQGIKNLLDADQRLTVVGWEADFAQAIQRIKETNPDIVLQITKDGSAPSAMTCESLTKLGIKTILVELSLTNDNVYIYQGEQREITEIGDLLRII